MEFALTPDYVANLLERAFTSVITDPCEAVINTCPPELIEMLEFSRIITQFEAIKKELSALSGKASNKKKKSAVAATESTKTAEEVVQIVRSVVSSLLGDS
eukprot:gene31839-40975_t